MTLLTLTNKFKMPTPKTIKSTTKTLKLKKTK